MGLEHSVFSEIACLEIKKQLPILAVKEDSGLYPNQQQIMACKRLKKQMTILLN